MQSVFRMYVARRAYKQARAAAMLLQRKWRDRQMAARYRHIARALQHNSAAAIQSAYRMHKQRKQFVAFRAATVVVQSRVRRWLAMRQLKQLRAAATASALDMLLQTRSLSVVIKACQALGMSLSLLVMIDFVF